MSFSDEHSAVQVSLIAAWIASLFLLVVILLTLSLWLWPPKSLDPNFTSRSLTGWTNTPKKMAWANTVEKVTKAEG